LVESGVRSLLRTPLRGRDGPLGLLAFSHSEPDAFNAADRDTAIPIAGLLALAIEHERLHREEVRRQSRMAALAAGLPQVEGPADLEGMVWTISRLAKPILPHDSIAISVLHDGGARVHGILPNGMRAITEASESFVRAQIQTLFASGYVRIRDVDVLDEAKCLIRLHIEQGRERTHFDFEVPEIGVRLRRDFGIRSQLRIGVRPGEGLGGALAFSATRPDACNEEDVLVAVRFAERVSLRLAQQGIADETRRASEANARALALEQRVATLQRELEEARGPHAVVGKSKSWQEALAHA